MKKRTPIVYFCPTIFKTANTNIRINRNNKYIRQKRSQLIHKDAKKNSKRCMQLTLNRGRKKCLYIMFLFLGGLEIKKSATLENFQISFKSRK